MCCWRPHFEGLSQQKCVYYLFLWVVEDPILRGYHIRSIYNPDTAVVEDPILRGYHNPTTNSLTFILLLKTPFWGVITTYRISLIFFIRLLKTPFEEVITTQKKGKRTLTGVWKWFLNKGTIKNKKKYCEH